MTVRARLLSGSQDGSRYCPRLSRLGLDEQKFLLDADATRTHLSDIALGSPFQPQLTGRRSGADDLLRGPDPEFFELVCLTPRPGHELVELLGVQSHVRVRQRPQGTPACRLAFHAQPEQFQFFEVAER